MTPESYIEKLAILGIDRGQLVSGFIFDPTTLHSEKTPEYLSKDCRKPRITEFEDLSWMNPKYSKMNQERSRKGWSSMSKAKRRRCTAANRAKGKLCAGKVKNHASLRR